MLFSTAHSDPVLSSHLKTLLGFQTSLSGHLDSLARRKRDTAGLSCSDLAIVITHFGDVIGIINNILCSLEVIGDNTEHVEINNFIKASKTYYMGFKTQFEESLTLFRKMSSDQSCLKTLLTITSTSEPAFTSLYITTGIQTDTQHSLLSLEEKTPATASTTVKEPNLRPYY